MLSSSRGRQDIEEMVNILKRMNVDIFFCIGGDGTMRATECITEEINRRGLNIIVIGIPKTIDNDRTLSTRRLVSIRLSPRPSRPFSAPTLRPKGPPWA